ncbi:uncharacterized protein [Palaemon carinicauda]|uniref:uncharacterized protein n=1 Tax=Palaemon carinicauda TaxID=392227 RepID=UPI0035B6387F
MTKDWDESLMVPILKQEGHIMECNNYRGLELTQVGLKLLERVLDERLREIVKIGKHEGERDCGCIIISRQLQEKRIEENMKLFFVDLEKAYDRIPRKVMLWCLRKRKVLEKLARMVEMIEGIGEGA